MLQGNDKELCPCLYVKPNFQRKRFQDPLKIKDYSMFFVYLMEIITPLLEKLGSYSTKLTFLVDMEFGDFRLDLLQVLEDIFTNHYPQHLNRVFIVKINLENISQQVQ